jgi:ribosome-binding protein aMBF1 (putative translation factor)
MCGYDAYNSSEMSRYDDKEPSVPECQDWTTVTFNKRPGTTTNATNATNKPAVMTTSSLANVGVYKAASDDDTKKTKYVSKATSDAVRTARCEKKLTQKELAQKCNMDAAIVNEVERGGGVYNAAHINKIQSVLGVKIPR